MEFPDTYKEKKLRPQQQLFRSERDELLSKFLSHDLKLRDHKTKQLRPITDRELAIKLSHIPTGDLHAFYKQCENARSFGRYFWWALKPQRP
jgi:hypothetical protein